MSTTRFTLGESGPMDETLVRFRVPESLHFGLLHYITDGLPPGDFLQAVLKNDLTEAVGRGDEQCLAALPSIVRWLYNEAPSPCWGSPEKVRAWIHEKTCERIGRET